jgi:multimeric flavodoxin WrbA
MKRVTAFVGSARKRHTYDAVAQFLGKLQALGEVEYEIVRLSDYRLEACRGCCACFERGEEFCPLQDDRDVLMAKMATSDGIVLASPNYCADVSGTMKMFIDRLGFVCHRPRYFGKTCTSIVTQSIAAGGRIVEYLDTLAATLGFSVVKGTCVTASEPQTERAQRKVEKVLHEQAEQFYAGLYKPSYPAPSWTMLMVFRIGRTSIRQARDEGSRDYRYYTEQGWFESDYYYPTRLGLLKKVAGRLVDSMAPALRSMVA